MKLLAFTIFMSLFFTACLDEAPRDRPTFAPLQSVSDDEEGLGPEEFIPPTRPDGQVFLQPGHCGCEAGEAITLGNCVNFCQGKASTPEETLFVDVEVGEKIETSNLGSFYGWCTKSITYIDPETGELVEDGIQASCEIQVKDENGSLRSLGFTPMAGSNTISVNIDPLDADKTYRLTVVETTSGASSNTIQVRKVSERITDPVGGPLRLMPVNQYTCMSRQLSTDQNNGDNFFEEATRNHYYFIDEDRPEPLPDSFANLYCHDFMIYGTTPINNPLFEETPGAFTVWDKWDPRFFDLDGPNENGTTIEIHKLIGQKIRDLGYETTTDPEVFFPLEYYNGPPITQGGGAAPEKKKLGHYMLPFVDQQSFKAYCPKAQHYNSDNSLFQAMKEVVGIDTEGLYIAKQSGVCDIMLIRETLLKKIWFYIENGAHYWPNNETVSGKQIQFYWPPSISSPHVKKSHQKVYTIKRPTESLCDDSNVANDQSSFENYPTHDKRMGCVPAL